ncbi:LOW protein: F-box/FBD/LRR-like protein [Arabidopsis thaliana]|uniref:LOW protein: F-box/FBD/LRR-like protein n=1 Tax=Arabidopsis thaliana TaxID=3702 RepID=A0A1P8BHD3_ARATH|nr:LOW protein: F-box/FBD/LRR-like protein [Arabidopsis thaliana]ANM71011.1 LOW protein: F-box/FBD/LRR-like protein [Arabidopsis thaliana]|eukprot:NP_001332572.1 LOW protein: F-box/FBD/LRR-like protein [Arabidopsis thaliana]
MVSICKPWIIILKHSVFALLFVMQITCLECFSQKRNQMSNRGDRISSLPDELLCQILSNLPTKNAVTTSILSTRWRSIWLSTPVLDIDIDAFDDATTFVSFASRFLEFSKDSCLHKFKLSVERDDVDMCTIMPWIQDAVNRRIQHLEVDCRFSFHFEAVYLTLYLSETLVSLRLHFVTLHRYEFVSLPNLKVMHLEENIYYCLETLENFISSCPVLEDLTVVRIVDIITEKILRVRSRSLNSLKLVLDSSNGWFIDDIDEWKVIIDAPRLAYLSLKDDQSASFVISNLGSSAKADIKIICHYLKHEPMPQFCNMVRLNARFYDCDLEMLPCVLESCPNLKSLVLGLLSSAETEQQSRVSSVPPCFLSSLEFVEIRSRLCRKRYVMKVARYFAKNSVMLKKFVYVGRVSIQEEDLLALLWRYSICEIEVRGLRR